MHYANHKHVSKQYELFGWILNIAAPYCILKYTSIHHFLFNLKTLSSKLFCRLFVLLLRIPSVPRPSSKKGFHSFCNLSNPEKTGTAFFCFIVFISSTSIYIWLQNCEHAFIIKLCTSRMLRNHFLILGIFCLSLQLCSVYVSGSSQRWIKKLKARCGKHHFR